VPPVLFKWPITLKQIGALLQLSL